MKSLDDLVMDRALSMLDDMVSRLWFRRLMRNLSIAGGLATAKRDGILFGFDQGVEHAVKLRNSEVAP